MQNFFRSVGSKSWFASDPSFEDRDQLGGAINIYDDSWQQNFLCLEVKKQINQQIFKAFFI